MVLLPFRLPMCALRCGATRSGQRTSLQGRYAKLREIFLVPDFTGNFFVMTLGGRM